MNKQFAIKIAFVLVLSGGIAIASEDTSFRFVWNHPSLPGPTTYSKPKLNTEYSILSKNGEVVYQAVSKNMVSEDFCEGGKKTSWYFSPKDRDMLANVPVHSIAIEGALLINSKPVKLSLLDSSSIELLGYISKLAGKYELKEFGTTAYILGPVNRGRRFLVILQDKPIEPYGPKYALVSVVDVADSKYFEGVTYVEEAKHGDLFLGVQVITDIDGDGVADLILINHGDFYDQHLLIEKSGKWEILTDPANPC